MAWFFFQENITSNSALLTGETARHIARSLRMKPGEELTLVTPDGRRHDGEICEVSADEVVVTIHRSTACEQEPTVEITLFSALMKGESFDDVVQKAVELGATKIVPFLSKRCVSRPDEKSLEKKRARWQKIAASAAEQARRGVIPTVGRCVDISEIPSMLDGFSTSVVFYECGGAPLKEIIRSNEASVALITGAEGGFEPDEIALLENAGAQVATLGKRILRARTAPTAAIAAVLLLTGNLE